MAAIVFIACLVAVGWGVWGIVRYRRGQLAYPHGNERRRRQVILRTHTNTALAGAASGAIGLISLARHSLGSGAAVFLIVLGAAAVIAAGASVVSAPSEGD